MFVEIHKTDKFGAVFGSFVTKFDNNKLYFHKLIFHQKTLMARKTIMHEVWRKVFDIHELRNLLYFLIILIPSSEYFYLMDIFIHWVVLFLNTFYLSQIIDPLNIFLLLTLLGLKFVKIH